MKKQLQMKISTFIVTAMLFSASANAQIVYTDVIPDSTSTGTYNLDLNNDGTADFAISRLTSPNFCPPSYGPNIAIRVTLLGTNQVACISGTYATKMALNETIDASVLTWNNSANLLMAVRTLNNACIGITSGEWVNTAEGYLGLQLISGSNIYYGWARMRIGSFVNSFTLMDYAYNTIPNQQILAGQTVATGLNENTSASSIHLFPNPAHDHITIALPGYNKKVEVTITDITGKIIYTANASEVQNIKVNTEDFTAGIYVAQIHAAEFIGMKKLVIEK